MMVMSRQTIERASAMYVMISSARSSADGGSGLGRTSCIENACTGKIPHRLPPYSTYTSCTIIQILEKVELFMTLKVGQFAYNREVVMHQISSLPAKWQS